MIHVSCILLNWFFCGNSWNYLPTLYLILPNKCIICMYACIHHMKSYLETWSLIWYIFFVSRANQIISSLKDHHYHCSPMFNYYKSLTGKIHCHQIIILLSFKTNSNPKLYSCFLLIQEQQLKQSENHHGILISCENVFNVDYCLPYRIWEQ